MNIINTTSQLWAFRRGAMMLKLLVLLFLVVSSGFAQNIVPQGFLGTWEGELLVDHDGARVQSQVSITFLKGGGVKLTSAFSEDVASYKMERDNILVEFNNGRNEGFELSNIKLTNTTLSAILTFRADASNVSSYLALTRQKGPRTDIRFSAPTDCRGIILPASVQKVFQKYDMSCPIDIVEHTNWYNQSFFEDFLTELIRTLLPTKTRQRLRLFSITANYVGNNRAVLAWQGDLYPEDNHVLSQTLSVLTRLVKANQEIVPYDQLPQNQQLNYSMTSKQLRPEFLNGSDINYQVVWGEILNIASKMGIRLDIKSELTNHDDRTIGEITSRKVAQSADEFLYFERVSVQMKASEDRKNLFVQIDSELVKRRGFSSYLYRAECVVEAPEKYPSNAVHCSEAPYLWAVTRALMKEK
jgi:hypothetical protein